jgi:hypothetical protein
LFDVLKGGDRLFFDRGLRYLLESNKIMKVMHDCRKDSEALYFQYDVTLRGVWDSQIAYTVLSQLKGIISHYIVVSCCVDLLFIALKMLNIRAEQI